MIKKCFVFLYFFGIKVNISSRLGLRSTHRFNSCYAFPKDGIFRLSLYMEETILIYTINRWIWKITAFRSFLLVHTCFFEILKHLERSSLDLKLLTLTVLNDLIANKLAIIVEKPGARQLWAIKPNFNSAKQITSSPCFQSHDGIFNK